MESLTQPQSPVNDFGDIDDQVHSQSVVLPNQFITIANGYEKKQLSWFITSQKPTELSIQVQQVTFSVHKYPLISKCGYMGRLELQPSNSNCYDIKLENFPGGSETFEIILKFCYGLSVDFSPQNIAPLRCASEYLEMTEELSDGNLISKTESFLTFMILSSWKDTIIVLKTYENLSPWSENLQIIRRCCDSIAWKITRENKSEDTTNGEGWWWDEVSTIRIDHFTRIVTNLRAKGTKPEIIGKCIEYCAKKWLPGMDVDLEGLRGYGQGKNDLEFSIGHGKEQKAIIETLVSLIPHQKGAVTSKFLLQMLKMAMMCSTTPALISEIEKRVGMTLEDVNAIDLLIPRYKNAGQTKQTDYSKECTMYDTDVVQRIVEYFLMQKQEPQKSEKTNVSKLLENYLAEIARDPNLSITKFQVLADLLPRSARICDDGLYRAIDTYLKTHPSLPEQDRRRLCKTMNCKTLSLDACMHATQNDRLPLRIIIQVIFCEQLKMKTAMQETETAPSRNNSEQEGNQSSSTEREIQVLKAELESVKLKMEVLQNDYFELQLEYAKLSNKHKNKSVWSSGWKKFKNSFHTKADGDETGENEPRPDTVNNRVNFRRRQSFA